MKKEFGSAAGLLAILAFAVHTLFPPAQESGGSRNAPTKKAGDGSKASGSDGRVTLEGPWIATRTFFGPGSALKPITFDAIEPLLSAKALSDENRTEWRHNLGLPRQDSGQAWTIIATVADPAHTRMQLFFDGQIGSIERALAMHGWEFVTQWLPWLDGPDGSSGGIEEHHRERRLEHQQEALPGVLIFRRWPARNRSSESKSPSPDVLFVLLVPETPTNGVAGDAFYAALNLGLVLTSANHKVGLLAPTFSGSFESLTRFLGSWNQRESLYKTAYGGSVSSFDYAQKFEAGTGFQFRSGIADSTSYAEAFKKVLDDFHIDHEKAAYWVEEETAFGASFKQGTSAIPTYTFPREISHLRNAYQEAAQASRNTVRNAAPTLDISLKDPSHGEDSIPVFSDTHTPVAQSAAISTITEEFRREGTQMVFIAASNTLDSLLLARFVRSESPNTRVLIGDADNLFLPAASQDSLAGILFLSTYPMFILGEEWLTLNREGTVGDKGGHLIFPGPSLQGIFNVTQLLLARIEADTSYQNGDCLYGYRQLRQLPEGAEHPGLWLLTLTRFGFLPLDWHEVNTKDWFDPPSAGACKPEHEPPAISAESTGEEPPQNLEARFPLDQPSRGWYVAALAMSFVIFGACFLLVRARNPVVDHSCFPAMLGACLSLSATQWILGLPAWRVLWGVNRQREDLSGWDQITLAAVALSLLAPLLSLWILYLRSSGKTFLKKAQTLMGKSKHRWRDRTYSLVIVAVFAWISYQWFEATGGISGASMPRFLLFRLRAVQLFSGSSPLLPLFVVSIVFALGFLIYWWRYSEANNGRPDPSFTMPDGIQASVTKINASIHAPFGLDHAALGWRLALCLSLVALALLTMGSGMRTVEGAEFNCALYTAVTVMLLSLITGCYDLIAIWHHLKSLLRPLELDPSPGQKAFDRVTDQWPRRRVFGFWDSMSNTAFNAQVGSLAPGSSDIAALHYCRYIVYVVRQMQRIAWSAGFALVTLIAVLAACSVQAPQLVGRFVAILFLVIGGVVFWVFAGMERNWILSRIDRTDPGDLNFEFWMKATAVVALPLIGILIQLFPSIGSFVSSWVAPSLEALR